MLVTRKSGHTQTRKQSNSKRSETQNAKENFEFIKTKIFHQPKPKTKLPLFSVDSEAITLKPSLDKKIIVKAMLKNLCLTNQGFSI